MKQVLLSAISIGLLASSAQAASLVDSREALQPDDLVDWSVLPGASFPPTPPPLLPTVDGPFNISSWQGLEVNVALMPDLPSGDFLRIQQSAIFPGAFDIGEALLATDIMMPNPMMTLTFENPVFGVGTQIQADAPPGVLDSFPYTAILEAFDSLGNSLGSFSVEGESKLGAGQGVLFAGVFDAQGDIKQITFSTISPLVGGNKLPFAINAVSLRTTPIPEPGVVLGLFLIGFGGTVTKLWNSRS
jgi:opacity protein-like surface antigen